MKKIFLTYLFSIIFSIIGLSQTWIDPGSNYYIPNPEQISVRNITLDQVQNGWGKIGTTCAGCPAYWYQMIISSQPHPAEDEKFYYYYYFKFFSNSFYSNGNPAGTYLSQVKFSMNGNLIVSTPYILLPSGTVTWGAWMRSYNNNSLVTFTVNNINVH